MQRLVFEFKNKLQNKFHNSLQSKVNELKYPVASTARTLMYFAPAASVNLLLGRFKDPIFSEYKNKVPLSQHFAEIKKLFEADHKNIEDGYYLAPERILPKLKEYSSLTLKNTYDLWNVRKRIKQQKTQLFENPLPLKDFPEYYQQSFHYQSGGYLSEESAELYDYQVEVVFSGTAEAMRRHGIKALSLAKKHKIYPSQEKLKILDIACGTGAFTYELKRHFPLSDVTGLDLSPWYLKQALEKHPRAGIHWVNGKAESLNFPSESFDIVSSVYLFHELPPEIRQAALKEMFRVLKKGGILIHIDSLQKGDNSSLDPSLDIFPHLYHEPYYKSYVEEMLEKELKNLGFLVSSCETAFYSKILGAVKEPVDTL
jgi:ubiquinone/menaquinone biosynthesis C-methylase UbiE